MVLVNLSAGEAGRLQNADGGRALCVTNLKRDQPAGFKPPWSLARQPPHEVEAIGAPIQYISLGQVFTVEHAKAGDYLVSEARPWFEGLTGQGISLLMFIGLAAACWLLAKKGAEWFLAEQAAAQRTEGDLKKK